MKIILFILLTSLCSWGLSQERKIEIILLANGQRVYNVDYYLINGKKAYLQPYVDSNIILLDTLTQDFELLAVYKNHKILIPVIRHKEVSSIKVFYDNRLCNNTIHKKYNRPIFKHLLKKDYLIDSGLGDVYTTFKLKKKYELINGI